MIRRLSRQAFTRLIGGCWYSANQLTSRDRDLDWIVMKCLEQGPYHRLDDTARELAADPAVFRLHDRCGLGASNDLSPPQSIAGGMRRLFASAAAIPLLPLPVLRSVFAAWLATTAEVGFSEQRRKTKRAAANAGGSEDALWRSQDGPTHDTWPISIFPPRSHSRRRPGASDRTSG